QKCFDLKLELLSEILTGKMVEHYVNAAMDHGIANERNAVSAYELVKGIFTDRIGFIMHSTLPRCGASPDRLIGDDGLLEVKAHDTSTHLNYIIAGVVPEEYIPQMYWQMACSERQFCDFVSYDPRLDEKFQLFIRRLERNEKEIAKWEGYASEFIT